MAYKIAADKKKHFYVGIPLGILLQFVSFYFFPLKPLIATIANIITLVAICYGFELFSLVTGKGVAENMDAIAGIVGGIIGIAAFFLIRAMI